MLKNSVFYSGWMVFGLKNKIVIMDLYVSILYLKIASKYIFDAIKCKGTFWFIALNRNFSPLISRYGYICGEVFCSYKWINGVLTNFSSVVSKGLFMFKLILKDMYRLRHQDKKKFSSFVGFIFTKRSIPSLGILPKIKESESAMSEFNDCSIPTVGIVDSNIISSDIFFPVPGNDDSWECINFFCYFFCKIIISSKVFFIKRWKLKIKKNIIKNNSLMNKKKYLFFLLFGNYTKIKLKKPKILLEKKKKKFDLIYINFLKKDLIYSWNK